MTDAAHPQRRHSARVVTAVLRAYSAVKTWIAHTRMRGPLGGNQLLEDAGFRVRYPREEGVPDGMHANPGLPA